MFKSSILIATLIVLMAQGVYAGDKCDTIPEPSNLITLILAPDDAKFKWDELDGAKGYLVQLHKLGAWSNSKTVPNPKKRAYPLEPATSYKWRVKGICSDSSLTTYTDWQFFTTPNDTVTPPVWVCGDDLVDVRDGKAYGTVQIGTQCWMSENFNYDPGTGASGYQTAINPANDQLFGGYYDWTVSKQIDSFWLDNFYSAEAEQGVCPNGWHVPSDAEWVTLLNYPGIDGNTISIGGGSGFELPMSGYISTTGHYNFEGTGTILISSSENSQRRMWAYIVTAGQTLIERGGIVKPCRGPLRCIMD